MSEQQVGGDFEMTQVLGQFLVPVNECRADRPFPRERSLGFWDLG